MYWNIFKPGSHWCQVGLPSFHIYLMQIAGQYTMPNMINHKWYMIYHPLWCWVFVAGWRHALRSEWPFIIIMVSRSRWMPSFIHSYHPLWTIQVSRSRWMPLFIHIDISGLIWGMPGFPVTTCKWFFKFKTLMILAGSQVLHHNNFGCPAPHGALTFRAAEKLWEKLEV